MGGAVMDTEDRTVIASIPFDSDDAPGPPEDRTNPTADAQILESTTMDQLPAAAPQVLPTTGLVAVVPAGMAAMTANRRTIVPPQLWRQLRVQANQVRSLRTWQLVLLVLAATAFGAWLSS